MIKLKLSNCPWHVIQVIRNHLIELMLVKFNLEKFPLYAFKNGLEGIDFPLPKKMAAPYQQL